MAAGNAGVAQRITLGKTGPLDQPGCGQLYLALLRRICRDALLFDLQLQRQRIKCRYRYDRVLEEAAGAAAVGITGNDAASPSAPVSTGPRREPPPV